MILKNKLMAKVNSIYQQDPMAEAGASIGSITRKKRKSSKNINKTSNININLSSIKSVKYNESSQLNSSLR
jgi:hypothetical protein